MMYSIHLYNTHLKPTYLRGNHGSTSQELMAFLTMPAPREMAITRPCVG